MGRLRERTMGAVAGMCAVAAVVAVLAFNASSARSGGSTQLSLRGEVPTPLWSFAILIFGGLAAYFLAAFFDEDPAARLSRATYAGASGISVSVALISVAGGIGVIPAQVVLGFVVATLVVVTAGLGTIAWRERAHA